jgi:hypothetical protein
LKEGWVAREGGSVLNGGTLAPAIGV